MLSPRQTLTYLQKQSKTKKKKIDFGHTKSGGISFEANTNEILGTSGTQTTKKSGGVTQSKKTQKRSGGGVIRASNTTGQKIYTRIYKVLESYDPRHHFVDSVIEPLSSIQPIDAKNRNPVPITYKGLSVKDTFTPRIKMHLYWSINASDLGNLPYSGDAQHVDRDNVYVNYSTWNVNISKVDTEPATSLPKGWSEHTAADGRSYFFNSATQKSTYDKPL